MFYNRIVVKYTTVTDRNMFYSGAVVKCIVATCFTLKQWEHVQHKHDRNML